MVFCFAPTLVLKFGYESIFFAILASMLTPSVNMLLAINLFTLSLT